MKTLDEHFATRRRLAREHRDAQPPAEVVEEARRLFGEHAVVVPVEHLMIIGPSAVQFPRWVVKSPHARATAAQRTWPTMERGRGRTPAEALEDARQRLEDAA